jgi:hypothetical protein
VISNFEMSKILHCKISFLTNTQEVETGFTYHKEQTDWWFEDFPDVKLNTKILEHENSLDFYNRISTTLSSMLSIEHYITPELGFSNPIRYYNEEVYDYIYRGEFIFNSLGIRFENSLSYCKDLFEQFGIPFYSKSDYDLIPHYSMSVWLESYSIFGINISYFLSWDQRLSILEKLLFGESYNAI